MKKYFVIIALFFVLLLPQYATGGDFTQEDRDRLISLDVRVEQGQKSLQNQINNLQTFLLWGFGILFGGMGVLIGFVIWDRRTALEPVARKSRELEEKEEKVVKALKEYSKFEPKLAEVLKTLNL